MAPQQTDPDEERPRSPDEGARDSDPTSDADSQDTDELDPDADPDNIAQGEQDVRPPADS